MTSPRIVIVDNDDGSAVVYHALFGNPRRIDGPVKVLLDQLREPVEISSLPLDSDDGLDALSELLEIGFVVEVTQAKRERDVWRERIAASQTDGPLLSEGLCLMVTAQCNLDCSYCVARQSMASGAHMSQITACTALDQFMAHRASAYAHRPVELLFSGGEPLMNFKVIESLCDYAADRYPDTVFRHKIVTNGTLVSAKVARFLAERRFRVVVSMDGEAAGHDSRRYHKTGRPTHAGVFSGIDTLLAAGIDRDRVTVSAVFDEQLPDNLSEAFLSALAERKIHSLDLNLDNTVMPRTPPEVLAEIFLALFRRAKRFGIVLGGRWTAPSHLIQHGGVALASCSGVLRNKVFIQQNGTMTLCDYHPEPIGSVERYDDYAATAASDRARQMAGTYTMCAGCPIEGFCTPCLLELDVFHKDNPAFIQHRCAFLRRITNGLLGELAKVAA